MDFGLGSANPVGTVTRICFAIPVGWWQNQLDPDSDPARTEFRAAIDAAEPNAGHTALVDLERREILKMTITQNVDNLHGRAGSDSPD